MLQINTINLPMPLWLGNVNCYLVASTRGFLLVDTGPANSRVRLEDELAKAGCVPGRLGLIVLTHGDFDHTGNAAYLRTRFGAQIAMHHDDAGMAERGDMFWNRSSGNAIMRRLAPILFRFSGANRFSPDVTVNDRDELTDYGFDARVVALPGHSSGSIGILTTEGHLFCGDLFENLKAPVTNSIMDDPQACDASVEKLADLGIRTVYPGHGQPFPFEPYRQARA